MSDNETNDETNRTTNTTDTRFAATNDLLASVLVGALVTLTVWFAVETGDVPLWLASVFALAAITAVVWAFGAAAFAKAADALGDR